MDKTLRLQHLSGAYGPERFGHWVGQIDLVWIAIFKAGPICVSDVVDLCVEGVAHRQNHVVSIFLQEPVLSRHL